MDLIYFSNISRNTERFINKLEWAEGETFQIPLRPKYEQMFTTQTDYVLFVPSYGDATRGHVPPQVVKFLSNPENRKHCRAVIGSGNINFGAEYAKAGHTVAKNLNIPLLYTYELAGTTTDVEKVKNGLLLFQEMLSTASATTTVSK